MKTASRALLVLLAASLGLKLAVWWSVTSSDPSLFLQRDSHSYHDAARALPDPVRCGDLEVLQARMPLPEDPEARQRLTALSTQLEGKPLRKTIWVPNKVLNLIV